MLPCISRFGHDVARLYERTRAVRPVFRQSPNVLRAGPDLSTEDSSVRDLQNSNLSAEAQAKRVKQQPMPLHLSGPWPPRPALGGLSGYKERHVWVY